MVPTKAQVSVDTGAETWLVNAAVEAGRDDLVRELIAEVENENNQGRVRGAAFQDS